MFSSDPVIDYLHHEYEAEKWLQSRPECSICDKCVSENRQWIDEYDD